MKLKSIKIENYRSIGEVDISFDDLGDGLRILIGINESGKTNILKAISAISGEFVFDPLVDARFAPGDEIKKLYPTIEYYFSLGGVEIEKILTSLFGEIRNDWPLVLSALTANPIDKIITDVVYEITVNEGDELCGDVYCTVDEKIFSAKKNYLVASDSAPNPIQLQLEYGVVKSVIPGEIIDFVPTEISNWPEVEGFFVTATTRIIAEAIGKGVEAYVNANLPNVVFWNYDESLLKTDDIDVQQFAANPNLSKPLQSIFKLSGVDDIQGEIDNALTHSSLMHRLTDKLSTNATKYINNVWKDYDDLKIEITQIQNQFSMTIKDDSNIYRISQRSDGFKRFISFLLLLSAASESDEIEDGTVILMDEPEISLHPSGVKYLRNELVKLGRTNYCLAATHSIFMIDRSNIGRHYIVKKNHETTCTKQSTFQNFTDEEVLFNALGHSLFDVIKPINIMFEGWTDRQVFSIVDREFPWVQPDSDWMQKVGVGWSSSVNKITQTIGYFFWNGDRYFLIITDDDGAAISERKKMEGCYPGDRYDFMTYLELSKKKKSPVTLEDLLPPQVMVNVFNRHLDVVIDEPSKHFPISWLQNGSALKKWKEFISKHYRDRARELSKGFKKHIPKEIESYIENSDKESLKLKNDFKHLIEVRNRIAEKLNEIQKVK